MASDMEHRFTSTGIKFWRHRPQMEAYRTGKPATVISTHISPTSYCNLHCSYCSVSKRTSHNQISFEVIQDYVIKLKSCGLKAVILTGGGEPLSYPMINELIIWLREVCGLHIGLITNGTLSGRMDKRAWKALSWLRLSLNNIPNFLDRTYIPTKDMSDDCVLGASIIFAGKNKRWDWLEKTKDLVEKLNLQYVRLLPDCMLPQDELKIAHRNVACVCQWFHDARYFHQRKNHRAPKSEVCHQAYFRPYLSEEISITSGQPGSVYPCDSLVLNDAVSRFASKFQLCAAGDVLKFLNGGVLPKFYPCDDCTGCVFADNVDMLGAWKQGKLDRFAEFPNPLKHEDFV